jgi:2'-5' RNA ligase
VRQLRFEKEKKGFRPHLTLGRLRRPGKLTELHDYIESYQFDPIGLNLDRLVLFKSTLTPSGSIYERLHEAPLGQPRFE